MDITANSNPILFVYQNS